VILTLAISQFIECCSYVVTAILININMLLLYIILELFIFLCVSLCIIVGIITPKRGLIVRTMQVRIIQKRGLYQCFEINLTWVWTVLAAAFITFFTCFHLKLISTLILKYFLNIFGYFLHILLKKYSLHSLVLILLHEF